MTTRMMTITIQTTTTRKEEEREVTLVRLLPATSIHMRSFHAIFLSVRRYC